MLSKVHERIPSGTGSEEQIVRLMKELGEPERIDALYTQLMESTSSEDGWGDS